MLKYKSYIKGTKRKILVEEDLTVGAAIRFLNANRNGVIYLDDKEVTKEELRNVKDIRSDDRPGEDSSASSAGEISKDSDRKLFESAEYNSE